MRKTILLISLLINSLYGFCGINDSLTFSESEQLKKEVASFIDIVRPNSMQDGKYNVYIAYIYNLNEKKNDFCFTLGYIENEFIVKYIHPNYVFYFEEEIVLVIMPASKKKLIKELGMHKILEQDSSKILNKLYPREEGMIHGRREGLTYCNEDNHKIQRNHYRDSDDIPEERSFYRLPPGAVIEKVEKID